MNKILFVTMNHEHANDMHINNVQAFLEISQVDFLDLAMFRKRVWKED